jgi:opacity protein-like surface antigen
MPLGPINQDMAETRYVERLPRKDIDMRVTGLFVAAALIATPALAQNPRGYVEGSGGIDVSSTALATSSLASGYGGIQAGVRAAPHVVVFGEVGRFKNLEPSDVQPTVDATIASLSSNLGLDVTGTGSLHAAYGLGGVRVQGSERRHVTPYVLGGIGVAHLMPTAAFAYTDGTVPNTDPTAPAPTVGSDVTSQIIGAGDFTQPMASSAFMFSLGGGAQFDLARHLVADVGYRFSRINADTPLRAQGVTFGLGVRF